MEWLHWVHCFCEEVHLVYGQLARSKEGFGLESDLYIA